MYTKNISKIKVINNVIKIMSKNNTHQINISKVTGINNVTKNIPKNNVT